MEYRESIVIDASVKDFAFVPWRGNTWLATPVV